MKITEIKVTAGKDVFLLSPKAVQVISGGKSFFLPDKLAAQLFKAVATPAEKMCGELKDWKP
jgi:tRNA-binding EMAP/Myf-like protein